jgi:predicted RNase H-like HicB family nuclease
MFEFRLRILDVGEGSFLGIVEGFPEILVHATSPQQAEADLTRALMNHLERLQDREATRIDWDDFPTVRIAALYVIARSG